MTRLFIIIHSKLLHTRVIHPWWCCLSCFFLTMALAGVDAGPSWECDFVGSYHSLAPQCCCFSADGSLLAVGFQEVVTLWSPATWELLTTLSQPPGDIRLDLKKKLTIILVVMLVVRRGITIWMNFSDLRFHHLTVIHCGNCTLDCCFASSGVTATKGAFETSLCSVVKMFQSYRFISIRFWTKTCERSVAEIFSHTWELNIFKCCRQISDFSRRRRPQRAFVGAEFQSSPTDRLSLALHKRPPQMFSSVKGNAWENCKTEAVKFWRPHVCPNDTWKREKWPLGRHMLIWVD